jgi:NADH-quinone oxidoreductase subunit J
VCAILLVGDSARAESVPDAEIVKAAAPGGWVEAVLFYFLAAMTAVSAIGVCVTTNIVRMAVWLFMALSAVAMLYFLLAANFLGAIQLIVYVGGTLVLLIFGVMLTSKSPWARFDCPKIEIVGAAAVCVTLFACLCIVLTGTVWHGVHEIIPGAAVIDIGRRLVTTYVVPFEVAGVLLMIVMVGAAHLARQGK